MEETTSIIRFIISFQMSTINPLKSLLAILGTLSLFSGTTAAILNQRLNNKALNQGHDIILMSQHQGDPSAGQDTPLSDSMSSSQVMEGAAQPLGSFFCPGSYVMCADGCTCCWMYTECWGCCPFLHVSILRI